MQSIGILRLSALGDVAMTVPLINALRQKYPEATLHWIISRPFDRLVSGMPQVNLIVIDKPQGLRGFWRCYQQLKKYRFDILLVPQASFRSNLICWLARSKRKIGYEKLHARDGQRWFVHETVPALQEHLIDSFLQFAKYLDADTKQLDWQLPLSDADKQWAKEKTANIHGIKLAVGLVASKKERNWPITRYAETLNQLYQCWQITPILIGGPSPEEIALAETLSKALTGPYVNLVGQSTFKQLAALLGEADALLAPDTGPLHISQAMATPVVGLYAVAPPEKTGPYFSRAWVVSKFPEAVKTLLGKDPNQVGWRQRVHDPKAMRLIEVPEVVSTLEKLFDHLHLSTYHIGDRIGTMPPANVV